MGPAGFFVDLYEYLQRDERHVHKTEHNCFFSVVVQYPIIRQILTQILPFALYCFSTFSVFCKIWGRRLFSLLY